MTTDPHRPDDTTMYMLAVKITADVTPYEVARALTQHFGVRTSLVTEPYRHLHKLEERIARLEENAKRHQVADWSTDPHQ